MLRLKLAALGAALLLAAIAVGLWAAAAGAATSLTVSTTADTGKAAGACGNSGITTPPSPLSLREATCLANNIGGAVNINLPAGTYKLSNGELTPGKFAGQTVNIIGSGAATTIIDGQGQSRVLNIDGETVGNVKSTISGLTVTGGADSTIGAAGILDGSNTAALPDELTLESVIVTGNQANAAAQSAINNPGGGVAMIGGKITVENSTFSNNGSYSSPGSALAYFTQGGGAPQAMKISNSTFSNNHATNANKSVPSGGTVYTKGLAAELEITDSRFINNDVIGSNTGVAVGAGVWDERGNVTILRSTFSGNSVSNSAGSATGAAVATTTSGDTVTMHYNRIVGNTPTASAVAGSTGTVVATENWWGCNAGPGNAGCDGTSGTVTSSPRLQFNATASPTTVAGPNGTSTLTAGFRTDSASQPVANANLTAFTGANVTWKEPTPSPATVNGSTGTTTTAIAAGVATAAYNSQSAPAGAGHAVATFDNASQTIPITVDQKPVVTQNPSNQSVAPGATATFTAAASGTPTPTVQWQRNTGSGFADIPGATSTTYSFTAAAGENGYTFRAVFSNTIEGTTTPVNTSAATLTVTKATPTLSSTATGAALGGAVHDTANLAGGSSPTGSLVFSLYGSADTSCTGTAVFTSTIGVEHGNGSYESTAFTPATAGEYRWKVAYSGDTANQAVTSPCNAANETSTVAKATPTISTVATSGTLGGAVHDTATIGGSHVAGGTVTFEAFGPGNATCTGGAAFSATVPVTAAGEYGSGDFTPSTAGTYRWTASYSGDTNDAPATSACNAANESSTVAKVTPTISTVATSATLGSAIHDTATITGSHVVGGTVTFEAFVPANTTCTAGATFAATVAVTGAGDYPSGNFTPGHAGEYRWVVSYSGDANDEPATSPCNAANEISTVAKATPTISTSATDAAVGAAIQDTATITGSHVSGGTVTFEAFGPGNATCTGGAVYENTVLVTGAGNYGSGEFSPSTAGTYRWVASYSGDGDDNAANGHCNDTGETSTVAKAGPAISTTATDGTLGGAVHDDALITGGQSPTGTVTFEAFGPENATCTGGAAFTATVTVNGNGSYGSGDFTPADAGSYRWTASYSGDTNNGPATSPCNAANETSTVAKATPTISTVATSGTLGGAVHDTATIGGSHVAGGTVTFEAFGPGNTTCTGGSVFSATVPVTGAGNYGSSDFTAAHAGEYLWTAAYSGDANDAPATSPCGASEESSTVAKATPTISTSATDTVLGGTIHDTATIGGSHVFGGTVTFEAFGPGNATCTGGSVFSATVSVTGAGDYGSGDFTPAAAGSYRWVASYSGDADDNPASGQCGETGETSTVAKTGPTVTTTATSGTLGSAIHDTATLAGGQNPTGTVTFEAFGPGNATCTGTAAFTATVTVNGNGSYASGDFTPTAAGDYRWTASYSGDADNGTVASACNAANETSTVAKVTPTISTAATDGTVGDPVHDTATITGSHVVGGTVTFEAFGPGNATCTGSPAFTATVTVTGAGDYGSGDFTPAHTGEYLWTAAYSGDSNDNPAASPCGASGETSTLAKTTPTISTAATDGTLGGAIHDTATITGSHVAGGTVIFEAFGPDDATCAGPAAFAATVPVTGAGDYSSGDFTPSAAGTYRWVASYSGDGDDTPVSGQCGDAGENSTLSPAPPPITPPSGPPATPPAGGPSSTPPAPGPTAPPLCAKVSPTAHNYLPKTTVDSGYVPGVRARIDVARSSELQIAATLLYRLGGARHRADLGTLTRSVTGARNLRLVLPAALREALPLGSHVRLKLVITTVSTGGSACTAAPIDLSLPTRVVQVLAPRRP